MFRFEHQFNRAQHDGYFLESCNELLDEAGTLQLLASTARTLRASHTFNGSAVNAAQALCNHRGIEETVGPSNLLKVIERLLA